MQDAATIVQPIAGPRGAPESSPSLAPPTASKRPGPPDGNENACRNGLSSLAKAGRVPTKIKGGFYVRRQMRKLRREAAIEFKALHGRDPSVHEHICLKVLARAEARAMLHENILANDWESLTHEQRTASLAAIGAAGDQTVRMSKEAGLNRKPDDDGWPMPWQLPIEEPAEPLDATNAYAPRHATQTPESDSAAVSTTATARCGSQSVRSDSASSDFSGQENAQ